MRDGARTIEQLKEDADFDRLLGEMLADRIHQKEPLDKEKLVEQIKARINPLIHKLLPNTTGDTDSPRSTGGPNAKR